MSYPDDWYQKALGDKFSRQIRALIWQERRRTLYVLLKTVALVSVIIAATKYIL